ncbi:cation diffusion facilitator family transporter [Pseudonocardia alaniniphila]|uniref:Cation diffusion facilitator family transporter n=1 Tax=Pseudonocardia alaniniphila TaxID=75291 RepID=A0ABS9TMR8_9PSEU|nr:cation diffusion facilitator family transporter [Pseudonocardia alaniniphila]MCH6169832.1 cation diffusion facilitator family transporter [Pseudonocardia alaniniphila]
MGAGHGHGHGVDAGQSASGRYSRRLAISVVILTASLVLQVIVGLATSSLALLSDAGHNFTDVLGIVMALAAITAARTSGRNDRRTFGLYRAEVLAALANAVLLFGVAAWVVVESVHRFTDPPEVPGLPLMLTAIAGLAANLIVFGLLRQGAKESINLRGAYLEVISDTLGSIGVLIAGLVMLVWGWPYADPIIAIAIGLFILPRTWSLGRQAVRILVQAAPADVDVTAIRSELAALKGVQDVHDVHVWTLTSGMEVGSAHLTVDAECDPAVVLTQAQALLAERHHLAHFTLQVEPPGARTGCAELAW